MVTSESSTERKGDGGNSPSPLFRYTTVFEEQCPFYMAMGMSYNDFWDGDASMTRYYRKAHEVQRNERNFFAYLQGAYVYEAIIDCAPVLNPFIKENKPFPYRSEVIPLDGEEERKERAKMEQGKEYFTALAEAFNKKFREGDASDRNRG